MKFHEELCTGWGRSSYSRCAVGEPLDEAEILEWLRTHRDAAVARGAGRSYGDVALSNGAALLRTSRMNAVESFDEGSGLIVAAPGVTFGQLLRTYAPRGWLAPVTPGTEFATIAGAIANDVHGKNHDADGSFGDHVEWFDLALADGTLRRIDAVSAPDLFAATIGGIGLTGIITRACFRMKRIAGCEVIVRERRVQHLDEYLDALAAARSAHQYSVGWIDGLAKGARLGRGIIETANHASEPAPLRQRRSLRMPFDLPAGTINSLSVALFNRLYFARIPRGGREHRVDIQRFFYPLDSILEWNRLYGGRGFVQFQCVLPDAAVQRGLRVLLQQITASGLASFLAVIKTLGRHGRGHLSFPMPGVTLALDFPRTSQAGRLVESLHAATIDYGGRIYLAKDCCVSAAHLRAMYPRVSDFLTVRQRHDTAGRWRSDMSVRLHL